MSEKQQDKKPQASKATSKPQDSKKATQSTPKKK